MGKGLELGIPVSDPSLTVVYREIVKEAFAQCSVSATGCPACITAFL